MIRRFIGDVHGKIGRYIEIAKGDGPHLESIQVGDFGAGFVQLPYIQPWHRFIRGNHDDPGVCKMHPNWIPDGLVEAGMMFVGGALSIDRKYRTAGLDWWPDEELSEEEFERITERYEHCKPRGMVTHDCPQTVADILFPFAKKDSSRTRHYLDVMLAKHRPETWIFGHWHKDFDYNHQGTRFICLGELSYMDLEF